jgi:hypothetical protein
MMRTGGPPAGARPCRPQAPRHGKRRPRRDRPRNRRIEVATRWQRAIQVNPAERRKLPAPKGRMPTPSPTDSGGQGGRDDRPHRRHPSTTADGQPGAWRVAARRRSRIPPGHWAVIDIDCRCRRGDRQRTRRQVLAGTPARDHMLAEMNPRRRREPCRCQRSEILGDRGRPPSSSRIAQRTTRPMSPSGLSNPASRTGTR